MTQNVKTMVKDLSQRLMRAFETAYFDPHLVAIDWTFARILTRPYGTAEAVPVMIKTHGVSIQVIVGQISSVVRRTYLQAGKAGWTDAKVKAVVKAVKTWADAAREASEQAESEAQKEIRRYQEQAERSKVIQAKLRAAGTELGLTWHGNGFSTGQGQAYTTASSNRITFQAHVPAGLLEGLPASLPVDIEMALDPDDQDGLRAALALLGPPAKPLERTFQDEVVRLEVADGRLIAFYPDFAHQEDCSEYTIRGGDWDEDVTWGIGGPGDWWERSPAAEAWADAWAARLKKTTGR